MYFYQARFYDPCIMQFNRPDILIADPYHSLDWNRYAYARYNPIRYKDPSGHYAIGEESSFKYWRNEIIQARSGVRATVLKYQIRREFGITVKEIADGRTNWSVTNLTTAYTALGKANNAVGGNFKTMVSGTTFQITGGGDDYFGLTSPTGVTFHVRNSGIEIPEINFLHETGHLLNSVKATDDVFSRQIEGKPTWVDDYGYVDSRTPWRKVYRTSTSKTYG